MNERLNRLEEINWIDGVEVITGVSSFPSGHTLSAFALFGIIAMIYTEKRWLALSCFVISAGVALSRVYLGHHFLKDIVFGAFCGPSA